MPFVRYAPNPKHKEPWQPGRKGSLCPRELEASPEELLATSVLWGAKRYSTDGVRAFAAEEHDPGAWHGWPVGWVEVPEPIWREWVREGRVKKNDIRRHWRLEGV